MSDLFGRLAMRAHGHAPVVRPRLAPLIAPEPGGLRHWDLEDEAFVKAQPAGSKAARHGLVATPARAQEAPTERPSSPLPATDELTTVVQRKATPVVSGAEEAPAVSAAPLGGTGRASGAAPLEGEAVAIPGAAPMAPSLAERDTAVPSVPGEPLREGVWSRVRTRGPVARAEAQGWDAARGREAELGPPGDDPQAVPGSPVPVSMRAARTQSEGGLVTGSHGLAVAGSPEASSPAQRAARLHDVAPLVEPRLLPQRAPARTPSGDEAPLVAPRAVAREAQALPTTVRVTIGRIEVKAITPPQPSPERRQPPASHPAMVSLEEYLKQRGGGRT